MTRPEYSQGVGGAGAYILKDGMPMSIDEVLSELNNPTQYEDPDTISIEWSTDDVIGHAASSGHTLTQEEGRKILAEADHRHDACHGISWDTLDVYIENFVRERNE